MKYPSETQIPQNCAKLVKFPCWIYSEKKAPLDWSGVFGSQNQQQSDAS